MEKKTAVVTVMALEEGFYDGARRRVGQEFDMEVATTDEGVHVLPKWVALASDSSRQLLAKRQRDAENKALAAALASSGDSGFKAKKKTFEDAMNAGRGPQKPVL